MTDRDSEVEDDAGEGDIEEAIPDGTAEDGDEGVDGGDGVSAGEATESGTSGAGEEADGTSGAGEGGEEGGEAGGGTRGEALEIEVPANLLRAWEHQAEHAKLSVSEYVVRMTEAGRMSVQMQPSGANEEAAMSVEQLTDEVVEQLRHEEAVSWEQLVEGISRTLEERLEEALERLQEDDVVRYSGLKGGYHLVEDE